MLSDVTMIIPTKDRQITVQKVLDYYAGTDMHVIIADSSASRMDARSVRRPGLRVTYMYNNGAEFMERVNLAQIHVDTPFAMLRADRRHVAISGIRNACDYLRDNDDFSTAQGRWYATGSRGIIKIYTAYAVAPVTEVDDDAERLKKSMAIYMPIIYSVFRTEVFFKVMSFFTNIKDGPVMELCIQTMALYLGKHKAISSSYAFVTPYEHCEPYNKHHYTVSPTHAEVIERWPHLGHDMARHMGLPPDADTAIFNSALDVYYKAFLPFYKDINCGLERASGYFAPYFDNAFSHYAPLILKRVHTQIQARPVEDIFDGLSEEQSKDLLRIFELGGSNALLH